MIPFIGEIRMFAGDYPPQGWALCDGSILQISNNDALFNLIGTTYGGDGYSTFGVPDMRGRIPVNAGAGPGLTPIGLGGRSGAERVTLRASNLPPHTHVLNAVNSAGTVPTPQNMMMAASLAASPAYVTNKVPDPQTDPPTPLPPPIAMNTVSITTSGESIPISIMQPYTTINFIIALSGIYPPSN